MNFSTFNYDGYSNSSVANLTTPPIVASEAIDISAASHVLNVAISFLATVFNGTIITFLLRHRSKFPEVIFQQTLCLSVTDLVAGLLPTTSCILLIEDFNRRFKACASVVSATSCAQLAVMINLSFLSIRRWIVLRNVSRPRANVQNVTTGSTLLYLLCPWIIASLGMIPSIRTVILLEATKTNGCLSMKVFRENGIAIFYSALHIFSLAILTIFYIYSIIALRRIRGPNMGAIRSRNQRLQEKAFNHLVAVLVVTNLMTLPVIINTILSITNVSRNVQILYLSSQLQVATTVINPIVYGFNITELKNIIIESLVPNRLRVCCVRNGTGEEYAEQRVVPSNRRY